MECLAGPRKGDQFTVRDEITIGRKAELALRDSKASAEHAKITIDSNGLPLLTDLGSANGTKLNGKRIRAPENLKEGDEIAIGSTKLKVVEVRTSLTEIADEAEGAPESSIHDDWAKSVEKLLLKTQPSRMKTDPPKPFVPCIELTVKQGLSAGQCWTLGFGPRRFGAQSSDVMLVEEKAPNLAFEIIPQDNGSALFKTEHPDEVRLNKESKKSEWLQDGDLIYVGQTILEVKISEVI
jgi:pSer/pThr/pTyr-binding forkhead associated (FHA) protein